MFEAGSNHSKSKQVIDELSNIASLDPRFLWFIVLKYKRYLILAPIIISLIAYVISKSLPNVYESSASLILENDSSNIIKIDEVYDNKKIEQDNFINTNIEILKSREIKNRILKNYDYKNQIETLFSKNSQKNNFLNLLEKSGLSNNKPLSYEDLVDEAFENINIYSNRNSSVINLSLTSKSQDIAYNLLSFLLESYLQFDIDQKISITSYANVKIQDRLDELKNNLITAEEKLQDFKSKNKLIELGDIKDLKAEEIKSISTRIVKAEQQIQTIQNNLQQIKLSIEDVDELINLKVLRDNDEVKSIKNELDASKSNLDSLMLVYTSSHPKVDKALKSHDLIAIKLKDIINENITVNAYELANLESFVSLSSQELENARKELQDLEIMDLEMKKYVREVNLNEKLYQTFMERLKETNEVKELQVSNAKILDQPSYPSIPIFPRPTETSILAFVISFLILFFLASYYEIFKRAITNTDVLEANGFDVLGVIPKINVADSVMNKAVAFLQKKHSQFIESIKTIDVILEHKYSDSKVLLVTSPIAQEGKTTFSMNIALSLAQKYKTLYLELDLRRPSLGKTFNVKDHNGISDLFNSKGKISFTDIVLNMENSSLDIITAGKPSNNFHFKDKKINQFIDAMREIYDYIIIDSAPILPIADTLNLTTSADAVIFVARSEYTKIASLANASKKIRNTSNCKIACVVNYFDTEKLDYYNYSKYGSYYQTYYNYSSN